MDSIEKSTLTNIGKDQNFKKILKKISCNEEISFQEKTYILSCAILFLNTYEKDARFTSYMDFSYYIILKYSLKYKDFQPLYDFSVNLGFYPISSAILKENLITENISDIVISSAVDTFKNNRGYVETLEQYTQGNLLLKQKGNEVAYIAPTSFGKSTLIVDYIKKHLHQENIKIGIIVPTKSLLAQTYKTIKLENFNKKILIHNEMYDDELTFIAIFTQERALRLLDKNDIFFDVLIIDEAHNLLNKDSRSVLLARLIRINKQRNAQQKIVYLSPLVQEVKNFTIDDNQEISTCMVKSNIKEPDFFEYTIDGDVYLYNRFVNQYYKIEYSPNKFDYIRHNSGEKNFIFINSPRKIEKFVLEMLKDHQEIEVYRGIKELQKTLENEVHKEFYIIKSLEIGVIYLHAKLPDIIKEYLEYKFKNIAEIKYVVANTVILEGINLPIDTLFIHDTHRLQGKELMNLVGRVNRLNKIFTNQKTHFMKLIPKVHFVNGKKYADVHNPKIKLLRSRVFKDEVKNPILSNCDEGDCDNLVIEQEDFLNSSNQNKNAKIRKYFIQYGVNAYYKDLDIAVNSFEKLMDKNFDQYSPIQKINILFIKSNIDNISNFEFLRLQHEKTQKYYENYILINLKKELREKINSQVSFFNEKVKSGDDMLYIGEGFGDCAYNSESYPKPTRKPYVKLSEKNKSELVNLAVVKIKIEEDFISFTLTKFIETLFDFEIISEDDYNQYIYGTKNKSNIKLTKAGLSSRLIVKLENDNQLTNLTFDKNNNITVNEKFREFLSEVDDFYKFEIERHLST